MARRKRGDGEPRAASDPVEGQLTVQPFTGPEYRVSPDIERVAHELIGRHDVTFAHLRQHSLLFLFRSRAARGDEREIDKLAKAFKVPALWSDVSGYDAGIWVRESVWNAFEREQQEAIVLHELLHLGEERGRLRIMKHDLEEFGMVVRLYGAWLDDVGLFARQLELGLQGRAA